jgi:magnesium transporter
MVNTLYLPELREMIAEENTEELREFCTALHPAQTAEFMEGLTAEETWQVLRWADMPARMEIFNYLYRDKQIELVQTQDRDALAGIISAMAPDDRVDVLGELDPAVVEDILGRVSSEERRNILRLSAYPEGTAGAVMTTDVALLSENLTVQEALDELRTQAEQLETIYYIYVVDEQNHLRGLVSARKLLSSINRLDRKLSDLMESDLVVVQVTDDQEDVAHKVARYDLLAIPVVDDRFHMLGIITHDDVIDVLREEALEDAHQMAAVDPLEDSYLKTNLITLSWKRGIWLTILFFAAILTAVALQHYDEGLERWTWLILFIPLIISSGGNTGSQAATLVITSLTRGHVDLRDWLRVVRRELVMGTLLGCFLGSIGYAFAALMAPDPYSAVVLPVTILLVVIRGTLTGAILPLIFQRLGLDPAMMSNPFVAGVVDILGIVIYMNVAILFLR